MLNCSENNLNILDVNNCVSIKTLYCANNNLSSLNVNGLSELSVLYCYGNKSVSVDTTGLVKLTDLLISGEDDITVTFVGWDYDGGIIASGTLGKDANLYGLMLKIEFKYGGVSYLCINRDEFRTVVNGHRIEITVPKVFDINNNWIKITVDDCIEYAYADILLNGV